MQGRPGAARLEHMHRQEVANVAVPLKHLPAPQLIGARHNCGKFARRGRNNDSFMRPTDPDSPTPDPTHSQLLGGFRNAKQREIGGVSRSETTRAFGDLKIFACGAVLARHLCMHAE